MKKTFSIAYITIFLFNISLPAQNTGVDNLANEKPDTSAAHFLKDNYMSIEGGFNFSDFNNSTDSQGKFGYLLGLTRNIPLNKKFGVNLSLFFSSQNILAKDLQITGTDGQIVYWMLYDYDINILFFELPVQINYKLIEKKSFNLYAGVGSGFSLQLKDRSKKTYINYNGEIIDTISSYNYIGEDDSPFEYSGININAGVWLTYNKIIFRILYINKMYEIKEIDKTYTISLTFGYAF